MVLILLVRSHSDSSAFLTSADVLFIDDLCRWKEALYFQLLRDCYEAVVIASFFSLLLYYLGDNEQEHAIVFKNVQFKKWIWPLGRWRYKPSGPRFLSIMQWSIGQ